ncbi:DNA-directed RNA polymerase subunit delta [Ileibacterium valens]|uniref:DNA-directed RNA polymerase subunit delta n=1 Tax=Ileibacterium valens TaxID=1862668 RepID=UPI00259B5B00|nr:DNA-directed RNA polymerase subunit delta [Ileibacterium valens]
MKKSMIETAYHVLSDEKHPMPFLELWNVVAKDMGFTPAQQESNIAQFFSDLSLDGRFANLKGNSWDLRKRQSLANTKVDTDSISIEDEEDEPEFTDDETEESIVLKENQEEEN